MNNSEKIKLSIIIVNFNSGNFLTDCLKSIDKVKNEAQINCWIVDNNSSDDSLSLAKKQFPGANFIQNKENLGFAKANNLALKKVESEYILFLNPDVQVLPKAIECTVKFLQENEKAGAVTCKLELPDGSLDWASHRGLPTPLASLLYFFGDDSLYHLRSQNLGVLHQVDAISGAFLLTKRKILEQVNFFDEDYFLYGEDLDLCYKIKKLGYQIYFLPNVKVIHHKGVSSGIKSHSQKVTTATIKSRQKAIESFYQTMKIFYQKNLWDKYPFFINWLIIFAIDLKLQLSKITQKV